jgi:hypothetical protein
MHPFDVASGRFGIGVIDESLTKAVVRLLEGGMQPDDLRKVEMFLRAFITMPLLAHAPTPETFGGMPQPSDREYPIQDQVLDYEFLPPDVEVVLQPLEHVELAMIGKLVAAEFDQYMLRLPAETKDQKRFYEYALEWCDLSPPAGLDSYEKMGPDDHRPDRYGARYDVNAIVRVHAQNLIGWHRAGHVVFSCSPLAEVCQTHLFSRWPQFLFEGFEQKFSDLQRMLRSPGICVDLPPLLSLVLSRARSRHTVNEAMRELRDEFEAPRRQLWDLLHEMWVAPKWSKQMSILRRLESAAFGLAESMSPRKLDVLSIGLDLAQLSPGGVASAGRTLLRFDEVNARVGAISFSRELSSMVRRELKSQSALYRAFFADDELQSFGVGAPRRKK